MTPRVGDIVWYRHLGAREHGPLAAIVTRVHSQSCVNLLVLDDGQGLLTDGHAATPKLDVVVRASWSEAGHGECAPRGDA